MNNSRIRWHDIGTKWHEFWDPNARLGNSVAETQEGIRNLNINWLNTNAESHYQFDLHAKLKGLIGSSILIAHRTKASDGILYKSILEIAVTSQSTIIFPLQEPRHLPGDLSPINIKLDSIEERKRLRPGKVYRLLSDAYDLNAQKLEPFYKHLLETENRKTPFVIVFDTLKKWSPLLEEHIRFLLRECPLVQGSVLLHCPLSNVPADLLSIIGNVIVIWPSQHEIDLLNSHFPAEKIPTPATNHHNQYNNRMLVFNGKPITERGWEWHIYTGEN